VDEAAIAARLAQGLPFVVRNASALAGDARWSSAHLAAVVGEELVEASFTNARGELNAFEPLEQWRDFFEQSAFTVPPSVRSVLVRPTKRVLRVRQLLELLGTRRAEAAGVRGRPYLHQSELHFDLPQLLPLVREPGWAGSQPGWVAKETNLWLSGGDTMTSLHSDSTENVMVQVRGAKEFLLFAPEQRRHLYYEAVLEVSRDSRESGRIYLGRTATGESANHGLVDVRAPNLRRHPAYARARGQRCRIDSGDALYVPGSWHHAVYSSCDPAEQATEAACNLGLNFWYVDSSRQ